ncbi:MAG: beta-hydroxyacyl-ACP dehydratase [Thermoguttaceae bacterium]|nr:beta-hydroxyacyl-ACP dehydratase [Thermoguttaceae bacterium]MBR5757778.1 beta-hydroxyacyl-ACP dehydratase [Thermoguttaceae bacterium]
MYFSLVDKIDELVPGESVVATKSLAMSEEYLRDHFPKFPVMPGVLMIEAMTQASAWLIRVTEDFAHSMVVLKETRNVKFGQFLQPGQTLVVTSKIVSDSETETVVKVKGSIEGQARVRAELTLAKYNLRDVSESQAPFDPKLIKALKNELALLWKDIPPECIDG